MDTILYLGLGDKKVQSFHETIDDVIDRASQLDAEGVKRILWISYFRNKLMIEK